jgi:predicted acetyltransferase
VVQVRLSLLAALYGKPRLRGTLILSTLVRIAKDTEKDLVHRLDQFYLYEFSPFIPDHYKVANDGLFHDGDYLEFWEHPNKHPYLIFHHSEIAGFALVDDLGTHFLMAQFFVMLKFQGTGVAKAAAFDIFDKHRGNWRVESLISNPKSEGFWPRIIDIYASGKFKKSVQRPENTHHEYSFTNVAT